MKKLLKNRWIVLLLSVALLSAAIFIDRTTQSQEGNYEELTHTLQERLNKREKQIDNFFESDSLVSGFTHFGFDLQNAQPLQRKDMELQIYEDSALVFWSSNTVGKDLLRELKTEEIAAVHASNGWYLARKKVVGRRSFVAYYPVYYQYQFENRYLQNSFNADIKISNTANFSEEDTTGYLPVKSVFGKKLFYVQLKPLDHNPYTPTVIVLTFLGLLLFFLFLSSQYEWFIEHNYIVPGTVFFGLVLYSVRYLIVEARFPAFLHDTRLFNPGIYASSGLFSSLGVLLVNASLIFIFVFTISKQIGFYFLHVKRLRSNRITRPLTFIPAFFVLLLFTGFIFNIIRSLILDSSIPFDVSNIFSFNWFSFLGLITVALLVFIHFLIANNLYLLIDKIRLSNWEFFVEALVASLLFGLYKYIEGQFSAAFWVQSVTYAFAILLTLQLTARLKLVPKVGTMLFITSIFCAALFYRFNIDKEKEIRKLYALKLSDSKDIDAEALFLDIENKIETNPLVQSYFRNPLILKSQLEKQIKQLYFTGYLAKYEVEILDYDTLGNPFKENNYYSYEFINNLYNNYTEKTLSHHFYYIRYPSVRYVYGAKFDICTPKATLGSLFILLKKKLIQDQDLFTELLAESGRSGAQPPYIYSYAMYQDGNLVNKGGKYAYTLNFDYFKRDTTNEFVNIDGYSHLIKKEPDNTVLVISKKLDNILQPVAVFSFLFLMFLLFIALIFLYNGSVILLRAAFAYYTGRWRALYRFYKYLKSFVPITRVKGLFFSTRIQLTMFALVSAVLLITGYIFLQYIDFKYSERQRERMVQKIKSLVNSFENETRFELKLMLPDELTGYLNQTADFYGTDINMYSRDGTLLSSTKGKIFSAGILSEKINPEAYYELKVKQRSFFIHDEEIGKLSYISTYVPVFDSKYKVVAYLNLPFFRNEAELNEEISTFFVNFVNLYILFFLVAAATAYFISQRITAPLTLMQNKLSKLSLGSKNEIIEWKGSDEIGELVKQYNKMLVALEESANRLAESEREGAWKEMAKQIAHEIKNPLTPMKLSVQHLQRAWANKGENLDETFKKVTHVLIEQIDSLSNLASEFSAFAKMPLPKAEVIDLNELLSTTVHLYANIENAVVTLKSDVENAQVYADKDQLARVFKNLITNALQAIPDEREGKVSVKLIRRKELLVVRVKDNGNGIPPEIGNRVFVPSFSTKSSGMGLGLAISRRIVDGAGGRIYFESIYEVGTSFFVELPEWEG